MDAHCSARPTRASASIADAVHSAQHALSSATHDRRELSLRDQIDYYRARAGEYDEWWFRTGRYDRGRTSTRAGTPKSPRSKPRSMAWLAARRRAACSSLPAARGSSRGISRRASAQFTAVDASPEVIAINRARVAADNVEYVEADLFAWRPPRRYDAVFFSFWLSHVPAERFAAFWAMVAAALAPGGAAYLIDSAFDPTSTAKDHVLPGRDAGVVDAQAQRRP